METRRILKVQVSARKVSASYGVELAEKKLLHCIVRNVLSLCRFHLFPMTFSIQPFTIDLFSKTFFPNVLFYIVLFNLFLHGFPDLQDSMISDLKKRTAGRDMYKVLSQMEGREITPPPRRYNNNFSSPSPPPTAARNGRKPEPPKSYGSGSGSKYGGQNRYNSDDEVQIFSSNTFLTAIISKKLDRL